MMSRRTLNTRVIRVHIELDNLLKDMVREQKQLSQVDASKFLADIAKQNDLLHMETKIILFGKPKKRGNL